uniref:Uncharacterized protein n=1 Tax=Anguilla anguilla TaxID=7936 RepID=A0A0E9Q169_ANGAN
MLVRACRFVQIASLDLAHTLFCEITLESKWNPELLGFHNGKTIFLILFFFV